MIHKPAFFLAAGCALALALPLSAQTLNWNGDLAAQFHAEMRAQARTTRVAIPSPSAGISQTARAESPLQKVLPPGAILATPESSDQFPYIVEDFYVGKPMDMLYDYDDQVTAYVYAELSASQQTLETVITICADVPERNDDPMGECSTMRFALPQVRVDTTGKVLAYKNSVIGTLAWNGNYSEYDVKFLSGNESGAHYSPAFVLYRVSNRPDGLRIAALLRKVK